MAANNASLKRLLSNYCPLITRPAPRFVTESGAEVHGILAEYDTPAAVYHAAERIRDAGYQNWDVHAPFPIHGIDEAMGIKRTRLPLVMASVAFSGVGAALLMQFWMNYWDYPLVVQGKSLNAWEPFVPVTFEIGVLSAAFAAILSMLMMNGLPRWNHPLFKHERFLRCSDDRFFICIESEDPKFDPEGVRTLLQDTGATHIELVEE